jgi:hypothetical protein
MKKTAVFDIEATQWINFACLGFFDGSDYQVFWGIEIFLDHLLTKKYRGWTIYAHFGGKYDFRFLIPALVESGKYDLKFLERNSKIMSIKVICRKSRMSWKFRDSFFLLPLSLKELGRNFKIQYMKEEFNVEACQTAQDFNTPEAQSYLRSDCLGLYEILEKFSQWGLNAGVIKQTLPSQAMYIFTTQFLKEKLYALSEDQEAFVRKTYFGGRTEIFRMSGENLYYYDFNSLYPTVMLEDMPVGQPCWVKSYHPNRIGFYRITANISGLKIPPLPVLKDNKLFFPEGTGEFYTTSAEIELLKKLNQKFDVLEGIVFDKKAPIFKEYVQYMFNERIKHGKGTMENLVCKLLANSLYGKFGQKRDNIELIFSDNPPNGSKPYDEAFGLYTIEKPSRSRFILPYLASYITSRARVKLYEKFLEVGLDNVWYCDTDSIITDKHLPTGDGLGDLKLEYNIKRGVFLQPKAYCLDLASPVTDEKGRKIQQIVRVKGMKEIKVGIAEFISALKTGEMSKINSRYYNICGFRECIARDKSLRINRREVYKKLNNIYDKRKVIGLETKSLTFSEI